MNDVAMRYSFLYINDVKIEHEESGGLYFEVEYDSGESNENATATFKIYNLDQKVGVGSIIKYNFGRFDFGGEFGTFTVKRAEEERDGQDRVQVLTCVETSVEATNIVSVSLKGQIKASKAVFEICKNAGLTLAQAEFGEDKTYPTSFSCFGKAKDELVKIANTTNSKVKIEGTNVFFYTEKMQSNYIIDLNFESGLIKSPKFHEEEESDSTQEMKEQNKPTKKRKISKKTLEKQRIKEANKYDYELECLSLHVFKKGTVINVSGNSNFNGLARIISLTMNNANEWVTNLKIKSM